jgi:translocator protein
MNTHDPSTRQQIVALIIFLGLVAAVSGLGSLFTMAGMDGWYESLEQPDWQPPDWLFGPVWSVLYLGIGVAAWLVWRDHGADEARWPLSIWGMQLALNLLWTGIFFGLKQPGIASIEIIALWVAILATIVAFWKISKLAAVILVPYLAWVTYAGALTIAIWRLN